MRSSRRPRSSAGRARQAGQGSLGGGYGSCYVGGARVGQATIYLAGSGLVVRQIMTAVRRHQLAVEVVLELKHGRIYYEWNRLKANEWQASLCFEKGSRWQGRRSKAGRGRRD